MRNAIVYQAYGGTDFINECRYSLLKYLQVYNLKPPATTGFFIYTDAPHCFADFFAFFHKLECIPVKAEKIKEWRGPQDFVHRFKIEMLMDLSKRFNGNLLYCDTDTYAVAPLEDVFSRIEAGRFCLHEYEGRLDKTKYPAFRKWEKFLFETPVNYNGNRVQFSTGIQLFNAGVVGLVSSHKDVLQEVLALTDSVYQKFPKHIAEQFAFSYCFQQKGKITEVKNSIAHYWNLKEFRQLLRLFFERNLEESIPNLVKKIHSLNALPIMQQKAVFDQAPFWQRLLKRMAGKQWRIETYTKKL